MSRSEVCHVGLFASQFGLFDMAGSLSEFVADNYAPYSDAACWGGMIRTNPFCFYGMSGQRTLRGGNFLTLDGDLLRGAARHVDEPVARSDRGFRCVR